MNNHFKCIGIVGHPRHPTALTTHEMLYRWLCTKGYEVIVEQQIAHELQLKNVKTGTLAEIGQLADLAVVVGGDGNMLGAARTLARYDIKVIGIFPDSMLTNELKIISINTMPLAPSILFFEN